ncbi:hypothetical protein BGL34_02485 [Fructilactobacillus lindneri]|uniref:MucBP domain-containing protein n=2 Tax=Fructilactobacillus lindneri TaxID=53444 RepID=A0A0R2JMX6_9LACO|nr:MucBP domain-containing protein [Fructilactobacillus lindneri]ANZ57980.1 hypothetical protein AYR60_04050 [Fructilactobacillus lindneri]ANZ59250.1 hypothetical protein AYR59_04050 [Fructilactobacillus lindneri]KRN78542.1 hypothetical protein IV52_GL000818 [Fructilactobacillus lindneri DSM 20690 = JCM 11027]POG98302.1 hypothetical protein BGL31_04375 [Fructilactobacillus lindneri]POH01581.1 hypothetical protein BGL32_03050 [Fructilactobacillus lindneri]
MLNFIKKLLNHNNKNNSVVKKSHYDKKESELSNSHVSKQSSSQTSLTSNFSKSKLPISNGEISTTIFVNIVDENKKLLKSPLIIKTYLGNSIHIDIPSIHNYTFKNVSGISSTVIIPNQVITLHYVKDMGKPVMIYCFDFDTGKLLKTPEFITGKLEDPFNLKLPQLKDYKLNLLVGDLKGQFTNKSQNIICYYRHANWKIVQPVNYQVKIAIKTKVYQDPNEKIPYDIQLPIGSIWKVFKEVKTNQTLWLSLGGAEWIKADDVKLITKNHPKLTN